jgi:hypothetical protein
MRKPKTRNKVADTPLWIDLGCGDGKQPGYIGVDRFALPGVDLVCDLDRGIPLKSDSVDYLLASHSLEHLRDLPEAIAEIFRVCKDRALITIIAPYDATRLNQANPYHFQVWNEHTARFFTTENAPGIDPAVYRFPAAEHWGLQASDFTKSNVDLRCLRMEFSYLPPYRGLDEETKRTLRHSLADVCDQMALHLLVVKSTITPDELSHCAATAEYRVTPAFETRRRAEAETSGRNLFSELTYVPARLAADSTRTHEEIRQLGEEIRRFLQRLDQLDRELVAEAQKSGRLIERVDHIDRALVEEAKNSQRLLERIDPMDRALREAAKESRGLLERFGQLDRALAAQTEDTRQSLSELLSAGRSLGERLSAINSGLTRRLQETDAEIRADLSEKLEATAERQSIQVAVGDQIMQHLVAERRRLTDYAFWPIRFLRRYRQRSVDLRTQIGGDFTRLWEGAEAQDVSRFKLQLGLFMRAGVARSYAVRVGAAPLRGIDIGAVVMFPPVSPVEIADYELSCAADKVLRVGTLSIDQSCRTALVRIDTETIACADGLLTLKLVPRPSVEQVGIQLLEWHRVSRFLHRVPDLRLAYRSVYQATPN